MYAQALKSLRDSLPNAKILVGTIPDVKQFPSLPRSVPKWPQEFLLRITSDIRNMELRDLPTTLQN